jgi:YD repeat-containing protein
MPALTSLDSLERASLKNDWNEMGLHGRVKSITEDRCTLREGRTEPDKPCKDHIVYQFNEFGFLVSRLTSTFDFGGQTEKYIYDSTGQHAIQIDIICREDHVCSSTICKYDDRGNKVEELFKREGRYHGKYIYQFDKNNRKVAVEGFALNEDGHRFITMTHAYDDHGNAIKQISIHEGDTTITTHRYKYDKLNRIVEKVMNYNSAGLKYNKTTAYKYNLNGELVEEIEEGWPTLKITITYDQHGNWVKKLRKYQNSPLPSVDERIIEYH